MLIYGNTDLQEWPVTQMLALAPAINALLAPSNKAPTKPKKFTCDQCGKGFTQKVRRDSVRKHSSL